MPSAPGSPFSPRSRPAVTWGVFMAPQQNLGAWDPNTNIPTLVSGTGTYGDTYTASEEEFALSPDIDGITAVNSGDVLFFDGTVWLKNPVVHPKVTDRIDWLKIRGVHLGTNGHDADTIELSVITARAGIRVQDLNVPLGYSRMVEVRQADDVGVFNKIIAVGQISTQGQQLSQSNESLTATARFDNFLYGGRLKGFPVWDETSEQVLTVQEDMLINPYIDQQITGNRSDWVDPDAAITPIPLGTWNAETNDPVLNSGTGTTGDEYVVDEPGTTELDGIRDWQKDDIAFFNGTKWRKGRPNTALVFVDSESLATEAARGLQNQTASMWDLPTLVERLLWSLNPGEEFVTNLVLPQLQAQLSTAPVITVLPSTANPSSRLMKNLRIPLGVNLPEALDLVCEAMGYHWHVEHVVDIFDPELKLQTSWLRFFKNGVGITTDLKCQRVGETITSDETNLADYNARLEIATPNVIYGRGSLVQREGTFLVVPGWDEKFDGTDRETINSHAKFDQNKRDVQWVGRFWALNEAGDYSDRAGVEPFTDLESLFEQTTRAVRRKFLPCLTTTPRPSDRAQRGHGGVFVEWRTEAGVWTSWPGSFSVADHQCGVILDGDMPADFWKEFLRCKRLIGAGATSNAVAAINATAANSFDVTGDVTSSFPALSLASVSYPPLSGIYTVVSATFATGTTTIVVAETVPTLSTFAGGTIKHVDWPLVRVTACIAGDTRQNYTADRRAEAPNGRDIPLHLDLDNRFHDRLVRLEGGFQSRWDGNHFAITAFIDLTPNEVRVAENLTKRLKDGDKFVIRGSTGNDGRYTAETVAWSGSVTVIAIVETLAQFATTDGKIGIDTEEAADLPALIKMCDEARNVHDGAKVSVSASLKGHDHAEYQRGCLVSAVQPRNLLLNNYHNAAPSSRYPQIVALNYHFADDSQRTELVLDTLEAERPELESSRYGAVHASRGRVRF